MCGEVGEDFVLGGGVVEPDRADLGRVGGVVRNVEGVGGLPAKEREGFSEGL